jgi:hypothetical protein
VNQNLNENDLIEILHFLDSLHGPKIWRFKTELLKKVARRNVFRSGEVGKRNHAGRLASAMG